MKEHMVTLPEDMKTLSGSLKNLNKGQLLYILNYIMRQYVYYNGNLDLVAEARLINAEIENQTLHGAKKRKYAIQRDCMIVKNAAMAGASAAVRRENLIHIMFSSSDKQTTEDIVTKFKNYNDDFLHDVNTSVMTSVLRLAGFVNTPAIAKGGASVRKWRKLIPEDTLEICLERMESRLNQDFNLRREEDEPIETSK